jgi:hypothetical protein
MGGMETRGINKFEGTLAMRRASFSVIESYKVEGKLLITSIIVRIM